MKKILLFLTSAFIISSCLHAQENNSKNSIDFKPSFAVKWNPASLVAGKIGLSGEYNFRKKRSITFGIGIPAETTHKIDLDSSRNVTTKTFSAMAGYRMYLGRKTMSGLYFEPYVKYVKNDASTDVTITVGLSDETFALTSQYSGIGVGGQLGVQFIIAKRVSLDLFFLGVEANSSSHKMKAVELNPDPTPWTSGEKMDIENNLHDAVKDVPIIGNKIKFNADQDTHTVTSDFSGFIPGLRFGASIGLRF
jgi:hypothetical protein